MLSPKQTQLRHGLDVVNVEFHHCCFSCGAWSKSRACGARKACEGYLATSFLGDLLHEVFSDNHRHLVQMAPPLASKTDTLAVRQLCSLHIIEFRLPNLYIL